MAYSTELFQKIEEEKKEAREKLRLETLEKTIAAIKDVFTGYKADEVYITGSVIVPYKFHKWSDVDIAVKGLADEHYFTVMAKLGDILLRTVEIIELEECRFADKIISTGLKII